MLVPDPPNPKSGTIPRVPTGTLCARTILLPVPRWGLSARGLSRCNSGSAVNNPAAAGAATLAIRKAGRVSPAGRPAGAACAAGGPSGVPNPWSGPRPLGLA